MEPTAAADFCACPCQPGELRGWISTWPTTRRAPSMTLRPARCHRSKTTSRCTYSRARRSTGTGTAAAEVRYIGSARASQPRGIADVKKALLTMAALVVTAAGGAAALADAPKTLKVVKTVNIQAPVDKVWNTIKDFDSLNKWHPGFAKDEIVKGDNNKPAAVRKLTIKDGPSFTEELLAFDAATHSYRYRIIESPLPVRNYVSH